MRPVMRLLTLRLKTLRRTLDRDSAWVAAWLAAAAVLEFGGRLSESDTGDIAGVSVLFLMTAFTWREHQRQALRPVAQVLRWVAAGRRRLASVGLRTGVDLRLEPRLPRATPDIFILAVVGMAIAVVGLFGVRGAFPGAFREGFLSLSAFVYFLYLAGLWSLLLCGTLVGFLLPLFLVRQALSHSIAWGREHRRTLRVTFSSFYVLGLIGAIAFLPTWIPMAALAAGCSIVVVVATLSFDPPLLVAWQTRRSQEAPAAMKWTAQACTQAFLFAGLCTLLMILSRGEQIHGEASSTTALTSLLGSTFAWSTAGVFCVLIFDLLSAVFASRFRNPAFAIAPRVFVTGCPPEHEDEVRDTLAPNGFEVAFAGRDERGPVDVQIQLSIGEEIPFEESFSGWPRRVELSELGQRSLDAVLRRRDEILRRRRFLHGLERLFKASPSRRYRRGSGFWLAPHFWFVTRMSRDVEEEDELLSGPPFHPTIPMEARSHLYEVLRSVEIDIVFVEDGVGHRRLKRVFRQLFEYYDMFGGQRRAEARQFTGLPGVRVMIHEFQLDPPLLQTGYPEPDYEDLGRARILHVFRDRGGDSDVPVVSPRTDLRPEPVLL